MEKKCKGCIHWRKLGGTYGESVCNYFFDTGKQGFAVIVAQSSKKAKAKASLLLQE